MLIQVDASQLQFEWRTAIQLSNDQEALSEILLGEDTHAKNQEAFGLPSRLIAKVFLFRTIFRGSGWSFANDPDFMHVSTSSAFWDGMNEKFYAKYHGLDKQHKRWMDTVASGKAIEGPLGRSWKLEMKRDYHGELKLPVTQLVNLPVQGTAADVIMLARLSANRRIKAAGIQADFISTVHDSLVWDTESKNVQQIVDICHQVFEDLPKNIKRLFNYDWTVPMECECKGGPNMKNQTKIKKSS